MSVWDNRTHGHSRADIHRAKAGHLARAGAHGIPRHTLEASPGEGDRWRRMVVLKRLASSADQPMAIRKLVAGLVHRRLAMAMMVGLVHGEAPRDSMVRLELEHCGLVVGRPLAWVCAG